MRAALAILLAAAGPAGAGGLSCTLAYTCIAEGCETGEITLVIDEGGAAPALVTTEGPIPLEKRTDAASGFVTYLTPVEESDIYFLTLLPDGRAMASGHSAEMSELRVYGATGRCEATP
jgi:hypothetical protein